MGRGEAGPWPPRRAPSAHTEQGQDGWDCSGLRPEPHYGEAATCSAVPTVSCPQLPTCSQKFLPGSGFPSQGA